VCVWYVCDVCVSEVADVFRFHECMRIRHDAAGMCYGILLGCASCVVKVMRVFCVHVGVPGVWGNTYFHWTIFFDWCVHSVICVL